MGGLRLSNEQEKIAPNIHRELDWTLFASSGAYAPLRSIHWRPDPNTDPTPLKTLGSDLKEAYEQKRRPSIKQTSPLSALQTLVKNARITMIDPVLASLPELSEDESDDEPLDPEELRRIQEREKIRELKRRRIHGDPAMYGLSGLALRRPGNQAVFVRQDQQDESAEVDIGLDDDVRDVDKSTDNTTPSSAIELDTDDTPATSVASPQSTQSGKSLAAFQATANSRSRRVTTKASASRAPTKNSAAKNCSAPPIDDSSETEAQRPEKKQKQKSETYKQAWSVEEQHLLERLLEEIPDGEKNRCVFPLVCLISPLTTSSAGG